MPIGYRTAGIWPALLLVPFFVQSLIQALRPSKRAVIRNPTRFEPQCVSAILVCKSFALRAPDAALRRSSCWRYNGMPTSLLAGYLFGELSDFNLKCLVVAAGVGKHGAEAGVKFDRAGPFSDLGDVGVGDACSGED